MGGWGCESLAGSTPRHLRPKQPKPKRVPNGNQKADEPLWVHFGNGSVDRSGRDWGLKHRNPRFPEGHGTCLTESRPLSMESVHTLWE